MAEQDEHKVRGGSALSLALSTVSPPAACLGDTSPVDSTSPTTSHHTAAWLSSSAGSTLASPSPSPAGDALAHAAATAAADERRQKRRLPFLSCFGAPGVQRGGGAPPQGAVLASEVGIRPCFYWLEDPSLSDQDRMFAEANARWLKSDCQDDAVVIEHFGGLAHQTFAGVFDGHGPYGRHAAKYASTRLPQLLAAKLAAGGGSERRRTRALREAFLEVHAGMRDAAGAGFDASLSGTTACCALLVGRRVLVASSGDSRCVVARQAAGGGLEVVPLTWDAKPSLPEEEQRILSQGGVVKQLLDEQGQRVGAYRVFRRGDDVLPGLAMSRSLGDLYAHSVGVSPEPVLRSYTLGERDLFVILATDGLWDIMGNEAAADFVQRYRGRREQHVSCAEALTLEAQERWKARHDEAIVDDISCVILHTSGLPPPERAPSLPRPLARAASCNDEANQLYAEWRAERERNPSNHKPQRYFSHLYGEEEEQGGQGGGGGEQQDAAAAAAAGDAAEAPAPPVSPNLRDAPQYGTQYGRPLQRADSSGASSSAAAAALAAVAGPLPPPPLLAAPLLHSPVPVQQLRPSAESLHRLDDFSTASPHSSCGDLRSESSEPSTRRGGAFSGGWSELHAVAVRRDSSGPQPIPQLARRSAGDGPLSLPLEALLRPVRKAYPSAALGASLASCPSDASLAAAADTPRSGDSAALERKVHGGLARSLSHHRLGPGNASHCSLHSYGAASQLLSCRRSADMLSSSRRSQQGERGGSGLSSPSGESMLAGALSPHTSPAAPPLQDHGRVPALPQPPAAARSVLPASDGGAGQRGGRPPAPPGLAEAVARGNQLSRTVSDCAGLVQAAVAFGGSGRR